MALEVFLCGPQLKFMNRIILARSLKMLMQMDVLRYLYNLGIEEETG